MERERKPNELQRFHDLIYKRAEIHDAPERWSS
jgi:hypothetical protein